MTTRQPPVLDIIITRRSRGPETGRNSLNNPVYGPDVEEDVWAARLDFRSGDFVRAGTSGLVTVQDSRYIVRASSGPWKEGDGLVDDEGIQRRVQGVSRIGRGRYLELLARRVGT